MEYLFVFCVDLDIFLTRKIGYMEEKVGKHGSRMKES